jgi:hypothetical protein
LDKKLAISRVGKAPIILVVGLLPYAFDKDPGGVAAVQHPSSRTLLIRFAEQASC